MGWRADFVTTIMLECGREPKHLRKFLAYQDKNPHVYHHYRRLARLRFQRGRRISIDGMTETLRETNIVSEEDEHGVKLPNELRAYYARLLVLGHPEWVAPAYRRGLVLKELGKVRRTGATVSKPVNVKGELAMSHKLAVLWATGDWPVQPTKGLP